jgi:hypothetical protein
VWPPVVRWTAQIRCRGASVAFFFKRKMLDGSCFLGERVDRVNMVLDFVLIHVDRSLCHTHTILNFEFPASELICVCCLL